METHARIDLSTGCSIRNRIARRFISDISANSSAVAPTPYLLTAVDRLVCLSGYATEIAIYWVIVPTYAPNFVTPADFPNQEESPVFGILLPTFGD